MVIDSIAAAFGLAGNWILATNGKYAKWGWPFYLLSNVAWAIYAIITSSWPLLIQTIGFTAGTLLGIWKWIIKPGLAEKPVKKTADWSKADGPSVRGPR